MMKRALFLLFILLFVLSSCANLNEEETAPTEYTPEVDVTQMAVYTSGASIILDWDTVRKKTLLKEDTFCALDEIEFDLNAPSDDRYIDYDVLGTTKVAVSDGGFADASRPNVNFLTDGKTRLKLCPDPICRADDTLPCTHINLVGGYVWDNYVYYIGKYKAEEQKSGQWNAEYENYLMRYSISEQEQEVVVKLPWFCYLVKVEYGVLYIAYINAIPFHLSAYIPRTILYDCKNVRLALIEDFDGTVLMGGNDQDQRDSSGGARWSNRSIYYISRNSVWRCNYDLTEPTLIGEIDFGETIFGYPKMMEYTKDRVIYKVYDVRTEKNAVRSLKDDGRRRTVIEECIDAALITEGLSAYLYVIEEDEIAMYTLDRLGLCGERTVVFRESDELAFNEHLQSLQAKHGVLLFTTRIGQYSNHTRIYRLTEDGTTLIHEEGAPEAADESAE